MGYNLVTIQDYFRHLNDTWCKIDTKKVKKMLTTFNESWDQCMHITKFAKNLEKDQTYLQTTGIVISEASKLQFYTDQMIDSEMFDKQDIVN